MLSMTGFGRATLVADGLSVAVEIKSVNHRFLDLQMKVPRVYNALEIEIGRSIKERLHRGRVEVYVRRDGGTRSEVGIDEALFESWRKTLSRYLLGELPSSEITRLAMNQPGVMQTVMTDSLLGGEWELVMRTVASAIEHLLESRRTEGVALLKEFRTALDLFRHERDAVKDVVGELSAQYAERLRRRMVTLLGKEYDEARVLQEVAVYAEKSDVTEELARLDAHISQFEDLLIQEGAIGRRLEFLLQEMNREVNTLSAKCAEHTVRRQVVEMKALLERMREQAANVE